MKVRFESGKTIEGRPTEILAQMKEEAFFFGGGSIGEYIEWLRGNLERTLGLVVESPAAPIAERAEAFLRQLHEHGVLEILEGEAGP